MVQELERAHRDLARRESGAPLESVIDALGARPRTVAEAYTAVSVRREWLYEWAAEHCRSSKKEHRVAVKF